jgi:hypothetical protein
MWIVLIDMRDSNGKVVALSDDGEIVQFDTFDDAETAFLNHHMHVFPVQYVEFE